MKLIDSYVNGLDAALADLDLSALRGRALLITGASGLIGSALADLLLRACSAHGLNAHLVFSGRDRVALDRRFSCWGASSWEALGWDASLPLDGGPHADFILHLAGPAHPAVYASSPARVMRDHLSGTFHALGRAAADGARLLYVSSSEVYGAGGSGLHTETDVCAVDPLDSRSCYPAAKIACEALCRAWASEYGVDAIIARPGHVYGPTASASDSRAHAQFARDAAAGRDIVMKSAGTQLRSYIHGTDCAAALLTVLLRGTAGEAYNIGVPGKAASVAELADAMARAGGVRVVRAVPTDEERRGYTSISCSALDCSKLAALGFRAVYSLEEGAASCVECLRDGTGRRGLRDA